MTAVVIRLPSALREFAGDASELRSASGTVQEILAALGQGHPQLVRRVLDADGELRPYVNVFVGSTNIRGLQGLSTPVPEGAVLSILPAVAGG